jgi:hypothetical protein
MYVYVWGCVCKNVVYLIVFGSPFPLFPFSPFPLFPFSPILLWVCVMYTYYSMCTFHVRQYACTYVNMCDIPQFPWVKMASPIISYFVTILPVWLKRVVCMVVTMYGCPLHARLAVK